jgi:hypothetical protein
MAAAALAIAAVPVAVDLLRSGINALKAEVETSRQKVSSHTHRTTLGQKLSNWWHRPGINAAQAKAEAAALQAASAAILASAPPEAGLAAAAAPAAEAAEAASPAVPAANRPVANQPAANNPFDQFAEAVEEDPHLPNNMGGGKRRNKSRKVRSRKGRKGLKSRKA